MNGMGLSSIKYEHEDDEDAAQETSTSGMGERDGDIDMAELEDETLNEDVTDNGISGLDTSEFTGVAALSAIADLRESQADLPNKAKQTMICRTTNGRTEEYNARCDCHVDD